MTSVIILANARALSVASDSSATKPVDVVVIARESGFEWVKKKDWMNNILTSNQSKEKQKKDNYNYL